SSVWLVKSTLTRIVLSLLTTSALRGSVVSVPPSCASAGRDRHPRAIAASIVVFMVPLIIRSPIPVLYSFSCRRAGEVKEIRRKEKAAAGRTGSRRGGPFSP